MLAVVTLVSVFAVIRPAFAVPAPTVVTGGATDVSLTTATLSADIPSAGSGTVTARGFNYGTTTSYGQTANENVAPNYSYVSQFGQTPFTNGGLNRPCGVAIDSNGNIFVVDRDNFKVLKYDNNGVFQSEFGTNGTGDGEFNYPSGIAIDSGDKIYIVDSGNQRIQKFNSSGVYQSQFGSQGTGDGQFNNPQALSISSSGDIYVADRDNHRIQKFNSSGVYQSQFGTSGAADGQFGDPVDVAIDNSDNVYVADAGNNRIQKFNASGVFQSKFGSYGTGGGLFDGITGLNVDTTGNIYVTEQYNSRVQIFNSSGVYQSQFGTQGGGNGEFASPRSIAIDGSGNIFVTDFRDHRVQKFNSSGTFQSQFGGHDAGELYIPRQIATDSSGNTYVVVTDYNRVQKFNSSGTYQSQFGSYGGGNGQFTSPQGIRIDADNNIYIVDTGNNRIQKFNSSGVYQSQFGSVGTGNGQLRNPWALSISSSGDIYVADRDNHRIQKFNSSGVYQSQFGNQGTGDGQFTYPGSIALDSAENIYVLDSLNFRVQKFNSSGVYQSQFGSGGAADGQFNYPQDIGIDSRGDIYVVDTENSLVQKFNSSGNFITKFGNGQLSHPAGITFDLAGDVLIADTANHRIKRFTENLNEGTFTADITGLTCGTTYHYQAFANNMSGSATGTDATFTTADCLEPDPPINFTASIDSTTSIALSWNAPSRTGDSPIHQYKISYKKSSDSTWEVLYVNSPSTSATLSGLEPGTEYQIGIVAINENNNNSSSDQITATTATTGFHLISNCQQLQDIQLDLLGSYELAHDIDCSATPTWNNGAGFIPIGVAQSSSFSGIFIGNNYSINNLYINRTEQDQSTRVAALFGFVEGSLFQDVKIVHPTVLNNNNSLTATAVLVASVVDQGSANTSINNVHIIDAQIDSSGGDFVLIGGLVGSAISGDGPIASDSKNEFRGTIRSHGSVTTVLGVGGLYGAVEGDRIIDNSYADIQADIYNTWTGGTTNTLAAGIVATHGLFQGLPSNLQINHSYAAGNISSDSAAPGSVEAIGGLSAASTQHLSVANSFSQTAFISPTHAATEVIGGALGGTFGPYAPVSSNNYFDTDVAGTVNCIDSQFGVLAGCTGVTGNPAYFYNNTINSPLDTWDFTNIWTSTNTLPVFGKKALTTITQIPASRLNQTPKSASQTSNRLPEGVVDSVSQLSKTRPLRARITNPTTQEDKGIIGAIKKFFKNIPANVLISFPYVFFVLLLIGAIAMLIEVGLQYRRLRTIALLITRQKAVAEERDTFWHLAANYLRAPITLMVGGIELLGSGTDIRSPAITNLEATARSLQKKVSDIMAHIEQSTTLQDIEWPKLESSHRVVGQLRFWLPVGVVAVFALLMNYVAKDYRHLNIGVINLGVQVLIFVLVSVLFYWVLNALGIVSRKRNQAEALLNKQSNHLDSARTEFIEQSASTLNKDLSILEGQLDNFAQTSAPASSVGIVREGAHRLRSIIDSFALLIAAQNNKLDSLSPQNAHSQLSTVFNQVLTSLEPVLVQKHIKVVKPDMSHIDIPGNTLLLNQVIGSVLSNAIAFSPDGSTIKLNLKGQKDTLKLSVTNQGQVISKDQLSHVFSPFTKADGYDGLQLDHGGLGVNLYIDKLIMQHLGGGMNITSEAGRGTTMTMLWPVN